MIEGTVTGDREIVIDVEAVDVQHGVVHVRAVVDTGFNGYMTLPQDELTRLGASFSGTRRAELGDGRLVEMDVYLLRIRWQEEERDILALHADAIPVVGMSLLWGSRVRFDAREDGPAMIESL